jgi:hypothetical protein
MKLYQEAAQLCGRVDLPLSAIHTEIWLTGTPRNQNKPVSSSQLWFDPEIQRFIKRTAFAPHGPGLPFGASWLMLDQRPEKVKSQKQRAQEKYKVLVAYWEHPKNLSVPYQLKWSYTRVRPGVIWYQGELGEFCDTCKAEVHSQDISIHEGRILRCSPCYEAWRAKQKELAGRRTRRPQRDMGFNSQVPTPPIMVMQDVDIEAGEEANIAIPVHSRCCRLSSFPPRSGDTLTQRDARGMAIQATVIRGPNWVVPLTPEAASLSYDSVMSGRLMITFEVQEPLTENVGFRSQNWRPRRETEPPGPITSLLNDFRRLSPLGRMVTAGLGALALRSLLPPPVPQAAASPSLGDVLGLTPTKEISNDEDEVLDGK